MRGASTWIDRTRVLAALAVLGLATAAVSQQQLWVTALPPDPHASIYIQGQCTVCHATYLKEVEPHEFVVSISDNCRQEECHPSGRRGRSHPLGAEYKRSKLVGPPPAGLPLENGRLSCGTCHQPHAAGLSMTPCRPDQEPSLILVQTVEGKRREVPYYKSYYLRVTGLPKDGFLPLCNSCHNW